MILSSLLLLSLLHLLPLNLPQFQPVETYCDIVDTLVMARQKRPGQKNNLDALCKHYGVDNSQRDLHGALLDAEILADVYLELIGGRQPDFGLSTSSSSTGESGQMVEEWRPTPRPKPLASLLTAEEQAAHDAFVEKMGDAALWRQE